MTLSEQIMSYKRALTADEVASIVSLTPDAIYKQARAGHIPCFRIGSAVRFDPQRIAEWLDQQAS